MQPYTLGLTKKSKIGRLSFKFIVTAPAVSSEHRSGVWSDIIRLELSKN